MDIEVQHVGNAFATVQAQEHLPAKSDDFASFATLLEACIRHCLIALIYLFVPMPGTAVPRGPYKVLAVLCPCTPIIPRHLKQIPPKEQKMVLEYLMFLKEKRTGQIKGRGCADGKITNPRSCDLGWAEANTVRCRVLSPDGEWRQ